MWFRSVFLFLFAFSTAACDSEPLDAADDGGPVEAPPDGGGDGPMADAGVEPACRIRSTETRALPGGTLTSRSTWSWAADGDSHIVEMDSDGDGTVDTRMTWRRIDATQQENTVDIGADGSIEVTTLTTTNASGQIVARETTQAGVSTRCTMVYDSTDLTTPPGVFAAREECTRAGETTPSSISTCTFEQGRVTRCDHDTIPAMFPQDADLVADGVPDRAVTYIRDGNTAHVRSDGGGYRCSDGVCTANPPDGSPDHITEYIFDANGDPELFAFGRPIGMRVDGSGDGTWSLRTETEYTEDGRWTVQRTDRDYDGVWDQESRASYDCP